MKQKNFLRMIATSTILGLGLITCSVMAAPILVGSNDGANCYPFSCLASDSGGVIYQEVYAASEFPGTISIGSISFFQLIPGLMDSAQYQVSFSTTSAAVGGLDTTWANNIGGDAAVFGIFNIGGAMPSVLTLTGTPFLYNPANGNLLMQVDVLSLTAANGYQSYFQADYTGTVTSRLWGYGGPTASTGVGALVTEFNGSTSTPEPEIAALFLAGLGLMGVLRQRKS